MASGPTAATRGSTSCVAAGCWRAPAITPIHRAAANARQGGAGWMGKVSRSVLFTCLGSPGKPHGGHQRAAGAAGRRPPAGLLRRAVGARCPTTQIVEDAQCRSALSDSRCPRWSSVRCATAARTATMSPRWPWSGRAPTTAEGGSTGGGVSTRTLADDVCASTIQASMGGRACRPRWTRPRSNARSARSTRPSQRARRAIEDLLKV